jgi:protein-S-isoprenylcysteine O-methyltransferase Ste14
MTAQIQPDFWPAFVFLGVIAAWFVFAGVFLLRKKPPKARESRRESASRWGIALQAIGFALVWWRPRLPFRPFLPMSHALEAAVALLTVALAAASAWLAMAAVRTLGKQWAYVARLVEGHKLVTDGPYRWVRNPIYTSMFGMLLATGLALSRWQLLLAALVPFAVGTVVRVRSEERLLREAFGAEFEAYAVRVPAVLPYLF